MTAPNDDVDSPKLGVVILGASKFPRFPPSRKLDNPSFARSAGAFYNMVADPESSLFGTPAILDLFDSADEPANIIRAIRKFLESLPTLTDVMFYYCGHGDFLSDALRTYVLTLRATEPDNEAFTALPPRQMKVALDSQLAMKRVYLVLDCCFAGRAASEWQAGGIGNVIEEQLFQVFPRRGTALIAASAKGAPALAPEGARLTMFTGALVETIRQGVHSQQKTISFRDVFQSMKARIEREYGRDAALPEIHAPFQPEGDISFEPFFINKAYAPPPTPNPTSAEQELYKHACRDLKSPLATTRTAALEVLDSLYAETSSQPLHTAIERRIAHYRDNDDSNTVRSKCRDILKKHNKEKPITGKLTDIPDGVNATNIADSEYLLADDDSFYQTATRGAGRHSGSRLPRNATRATRDGAGAANAEAPEPRLDSPLRTALRNIVILSVGFGVAFLVYNAIASPFRPQGLDVSTFIVVQSILSMFATVIIIVETTVGYLLRHTPIRRRFPKVLKMVSAVIILLGALWLGYLLS